MAENLSGKRIAALMTDGFEQVELTGPKGALEDAGATVDIVAPKEGRVRGWNRTEKGDEFPVDVSVANARAGDYDGLLIPGGVVNADHLRVDAQAVALVKEFHAQGKPLAVICHGPWMLIEAEAVAGRQVTSYPTLKTDLRNAGADWVDEEVVVSGNVITSRRPADIPAFNAAMLEALAQAAKAA